MWYTLKVLHIIYSLFAVTEILHLFVYEPIAIQILLRGPSPNLGEGFELGGRVWYPMKLLQIRYNLFAGTEMLSLSVYEPIASPSFGGRGGVRGRMWYYMKANHNEHKLSIETDTLSLFV